MGDFGLQQRWGGLTFARYARSEGGFTQDLDFLDQRLFHQVIKDELALVRFSGDFSTAPSVNKITAPQVPAMLFEILLSASDFSDRIGQYFVIKFAGAAVVCVSTRAFGSSR